jgi:hypothetical protein
MSRLVIPFPLATGRSDADASVIADEFRSRPREYEESRRRLGITLERVYLQKTPMGSTVVAYIESTGDFADTTARMVQSDLDLDRYFVRSVKEIHGIDLTQPMASQPEPIAAWFDPYIAIRGKGMAFCAPVVPDAIDWARSYFSEAYASSDFAESRRALSQNGEVVTLLQTPMGPMASAYLEGIDPYEGNRRFAASTAPFDLAFKDELRKIFVPAIDFSKPVEGVSDIFDSTKVASLAGGESARRVA